MWREPSEREESRRLLTLVVVCVLAGMCIGVGLGVPLAELLRPDPMDELLWVRVGCAPVFNTTRRLRCLT